MDFFLETREGFNLSLDRLGINTAEKGVCSSLLGDCENHASTMQKPFVGWAVMQVMHLRSKPCALEVIPSPTLTNAYHADALTAALDAQKRNLVAFYMATMANLVYPPEILSQD